MEERKIKIDNEVDMRKFAIYIASNIKNGDIIALTGDLGAGKTYFTKCFMKELGVVDDVTSPTFNIIKTYKSKKFIINHFDVYRIKDVSELVDIGFYEYINDPKNIKIIEWANLIKEEIPEAIWIDIKIIDKNKREIIYKK